MRSRFPKTCRRRRICKGRDLAIVDAASLRERSLLTAPELHKIQSWKIPIVWIDDDVEIQAPTRDKLLAFESADR